jgi:hypothetical protein
MCLSELNEREGEESVCFRERISIVKHPHQLIGDNYICNKKRVENGISFGCDFVEIFNSIFRQLC